MVRGVPPQQRFVVELGPVFGAPPPPCDLAYYSVIVFSVFTDVYVQYLLRRGDSEAPRR